MQESRSPYITNRPDRLQSRDEKIPSPRRARVSFDARSLLSAGAVLCWILAAVIELLALRSTRLRASPDHWALGLVAKGAGLFLIAGRGPIADLWSIALANALLLVGPLFFYSALQRIRGALTSRLLIGVMPVCVALVLPIIGFSPEAFITRVLVVACAGLFGLSLNSWAAYQIFRSGYLAGPVLVLGSNAVMAVMAIMFTMAVLANEVVGVFTGSDVQIVFYAATDACTVLGTWGYLHILRVARTQLRHFDDPGSAAPT